MAIIEKFKVSHISIIGSAIIFDKTKFIKTCTGITSNIDIAAAKSFLVLNILNITKIHHINAIPMTAILIPIGKIMLLVFMRLFKTYKKGIIKTLNAAIEQSVPFLLNFITGKNIIHANTEELIGKSDHVNVPEIAISQIAHTIIQKMK